MKYLKEAAISMENLALRIIRFFIKFFTGISHIFKVVAKFSIKWPGQVYPLLFILIINILTLIVFDVKYTIFSPLAAMTIYVLIGLQWNSIYKSTIKRNKDRTKEDKERLQLFFEHAGPNGIPGSIHFLSIYKNRWPRAWYYHLRGITRLSLYRWGPDDDVGSYTKFKVDAKELFHLQLKGCIDTANPDKAVEGINYIAKEYLTK